FDNLQRACGQVVVSLGVVPLGGVGNEFVAQSEIRGELLGELHVVLSVKEIARLLEGVVDKGGDAGVINSSQQEVGETKTGGGPVGRIAGEIAGEAEAAARRGRLEDAEIDLRFVFGAELECVTAANQAEGIDDVDDVFK